MFSKLKGIVHCRVILVTLLAKASRGPALRAHFECLALIWSFVTPHPVASMAPAPLAMERSWTTDLSPYPPPGREHWHHNSNTHLHILSLTLWHTSIFTTHPPNEPQPMVYFPAVHSHSTTPPSLICFFFFSFSTLMKVARQQRKPSHTHTPHYASEGFPDVLVYIMECAGRRDADSEPPCLCLYKSYILTSIHLVSMQMFMAPPPCRVIC